MTTLPPRGWDQLEADRRRNFFALDPAQQEDAIRSLAADGLGDHELAAATGLSVETIRTIVAPRTCQPEKP